MAQAETQALAKPSEEMETRIQMQQLREMTVAPGTMKLPCKRVTTAKNSEQMVIELDHPVENTLRFYLEKPMKGWNRNQEWVRFLRWYGVQPGGIYELQGGDEYRELQAGYHIYVQWDTEEEEWNLIKPPDNRSHRQKLRDGLRNREELKKIASDSFKGKVRAAETLADLYTFKTDAVAGITIILLTTLLGGSFGAHLFPATVVNGVVIGMAGIFAGIILAILTVPASRQVS